jgi:hypothetical protein
VNYSSADDGVSVYFPTVDFTFPLPPSGSYTLTLAPRTLPITGPGWTTGEDTNRSGTPSDGLVFPSSGGACLTTAKVAVMTNVPYGKVTLEFRWMWSMTEPNGTVLDSPWSVPTSSWSGGAVLPSIFFPAQYVKFVSGPGSGQSVTIGTDYTAALSGPVGGKYFFLELENGAGAVSQSGGTTVPANTTART